MTKWLLCLPLNPGVVGSSTTKGHDHDSSYDTSTGWFQEADTIGIYIYKLWELFHNQAKI